MFLAALGGVMTRAAGEPCVAATWPLTMKPWWSPWTTVVSLKAMTDAMNLDGPLEQTECLEDENSDLSQINPLGYLGRTIRIRTQNSDANTDVLSVVFDVSGVVLGVNDVFGRRFGR